jgi:hypothetical protein
MADAADGKVDTAITHLQSAIDALKGAQAKDDAEDEPRTLDEARVQVKAHFRRRRGMKES